MFWIFEFNPSVTALRRRRFKQVSSFPSCRLSIGATAIIGPSRLRLIPPNQSLKNRRAQPSSSCAQNLLNNSLAAQARPAFRFKSFSWARRSRAGRCCE